MYEIKDDCYDEVMAIVKKIGKYADKIEEALGASEMGYRKNHEYEDDDDDYGKRYKGMKYSRY